MTANGLEVPPRQALTACLVSSCRTAQVLGEASYSAQVRSSDPAAAVGYETQVMVADVDRPLRGVLTGGLVEVQNTDGNQEVQGSPRFVTCPDH